ncbi:hypothetical protein [Bradyrhizobium vignae]|uniref:Uncharacterized protein n=1 Tax=Bradyrhizobium vignae TaxID=1549949 RepID=A0A2U3PUK9_9BRAD|nr:hypothetical protein [Bradyrhizobium vignae]SPP92809.1 protein of unknown function [Bradyrhizobium vignae]
MKFDRFVGLGSVVGIILVLTMIAWLGLWGPVDLLYLKVEIAFKQLIETVRSRQSKFTFAPILENDEFSARDLDFEEPPELEEAWMSLDIFPRHLIAEIRNVRSSLRKMKSFKAQIGDRTILYKTSDPANKPWLVEQADNALNDTWHSAAVVVEDLKPLIQELAPEMDENDRLHKIHGSPGPDDFDES